MQPIITTFDRAVQALNLITPQDWRQLARTNGKRAGRRSWEVAVRSEAVKCGGAYVLLAADDLRVYTRQADGRVSTRTYKRGKWQWQPGQKSWTPVG